MKRVTAIVCLCVLFAIRVQVSAADFVFTAIPDQDETKLQSRFGKLESYLESQLGVDVTYIPVKSYAAAIIAFQNNEVQLAWFGGLSGVQARRLVPGSEAIAQGMEDQAFRSYFIANTRTGLTANAHFPEGIAGLNFTFGSKGSTSGRLMPEFYIRDQFKKSPDEVFNSVGFSGNHSKTIRLVESGSFDIGALNSQVWEQELERGGIDLEKVRVIWETPVYPDYHWTIRGDVDKNFGFGFKQRVTSALLDIQDSELLAAFPRSGFIAARNRDYQPILETARSIKLID